ncbi:hypothetical protein GGX14DRAFT_691999 [Mycena pura]|uniref:Uncharacterized protein n=1 Tax=Mycena pura TaxID=153505 RepID=A0AAD7E656_9AGAR|nr:hypothetical protein GGX14DRAFT_691999 [Mycena pura]
MSNGTVSFNGTIHISPDFFGCVVAPNSTQLQCCAQLGSPPAPVNGTFGCPFNSAFTPADSNGTQSPLELCVKSVGNFSVVECHYDNGGLTSVVSSATASSPASKQSNGAQAGHGFSLLSMGMLVTLLVAGVSLEISGKRTTPAADDRIIMSLRPLYTKYPERTSSRQSEALTSYYFRYHPLRFQYHSRLVLAYH